MYGSNLGVDSVRAEGGGGVSLRAGSRKEAFLKKELALVLRLRNDFNFKAHKRQLITWITGDIPRPHNPNTPW